MTETRAEARHTFRAMASQVTVRIIDPVGDADDAVRDVEQIFGDIERTCSRFDETSDLMRANAAPDEWAEIDPTCLAVIELAYDAYRRTQGAFDPRVLRSLTALGYDRSLEFSAGDVRTAGADTPQDFAAAPWIPTFDRARSRVRLGADPIDLGGIGKGFAVRCGLASLVGLGNAALVEAGGDLATYGDGPAREPGEERAWRASVEDPRGGDQPIAVLDVSDAAAATSSVRLRSWRAGETDVHHLIDPATGRPAVAGLRAVTIVDADPAWAEVWTKAAFLRGSDGIAEFAEAAALAALWVDDNGRLGSSAALTDRILWEAPDVR